MANTYANAGTSVGRCNLHRRVTWFLELAVGIVLVTLIGLSMFAYPSADDFCYAAKTKQLGIWGAGSFWYRHGSGRYTPTLALSAYWRYGDILRTYHFAPMIILVLTWMGFSSLSASIVRGESRCLPSWLFGAVWTLLFVAGIPDPAQTLYWVTGSFTYQLGNILVVFLIAMLIRRETAADSRRFRPVVFLISLLLVVGAVGANEISLLLTLMILASGSLYALRMQRDSRVFWVTLLLIGLWNMFRMPAGNTSQKLMRWRVGLQFAAICVIAIVLLLRR